MKAADARRAEEERARNAEIAARERIADIVDHDLSRGRQAFEVQAELEQAGFDSNTAARLLADVKARTQRDLFVGLGSLVLGSVVTAVTFAAAGPGQTYVIWFGPMLYGVFRLSQAALREFKRFLST